MRVFAVFSCVLVLAHPFRAAGQYVSDGIAAIVNDSIITYQDVESVAGQSIALLMRQFRNEREILDRRIADARAEATDILVERQLILHEFKTAGYNFPESVIEDIVAERTRSKYGDRLTLMRTLKEEGITSETYRQRIREEIIVEQMRRVNLGKDILISPQKILSFYEQNQTNFAMGDQVKLRSIVLSKDRGPARALAEDILRKLDEGASFKEMAKVYSDDAQRTEEAVWTERSVLRKELADAAFELQPGKRSGVVELPDSCWILLVEERRPAHIRPLIDVRDDIERILRQQESERLRRKWVDRLRQKSFVRFF